jgi:hypothetical protein
MSVVLMTSYSGSIHKFGTKLFDNLLTALRKCKHLESFTWTEQADRLTTQPHEDPMAHSVADQSLRGVTRVLRELPITELTIRSYVGLSEEAWSELIKISGLKKLSLWCMEGQPRVLQGWSETLRNHFDAFGTWSKRQILISRLFHCLT